MSIPLGHRLGPTRVSMGVRSLNLLRLHKLNRPLRILGVEEHQHDYGELLEIHWLGHIRIESSVSTLGIHVAQHIRRERHDWRVLVFLRLLPLSYLAARFVAVFVRHVEIALAQLSAEALTSSPT